MDANGVFGISAPFVFAGDVVVSRVGESLVIVTNDVGFSKELDDVCVEGLVSGIAVMAGWVVMRDDEVAGDECGVVGVEVGVDDIVDGVILTVDSGTSVWNIDVGIVEVVEVYGDEGVGVSGPWGVEELVDKVVVSKGTGVYDIFLVSEKVVVSKVVEGWNNDVLGWNLSVAVALVVFLVDVMSGGYWAVIGEVFGVMVLVEDMVVKVADVSGEAKRIIIVCEFIIGLVLAVFEAAVCVNREAVCSFWGICLVGMKDVDFGSGVVGLFEDIFWWPQDL